MRTFDQGTAGSFQLSEESLVAIIEAGKSKRPVVDIDAGTQVYAEELLQRVFNLSIITMFDSKIAAENLANLERSVDTLVRTKSPKARAERLLRLQARLVGFSHVSIPPPNPIIFDETRLRLWMAAEKQLRSEPGRPTKQWIATTASRLCAAFKRIYEAKPSTTIGGPMCRFATTFFQEAKSTVSSQTETSTEIAALIGSYLGEVEESAWQDRLKSASVDPASLDRVDGRNEAHSGMTVEGHGAILDLMVPRKDSRMG